MALFEAAAPAATGLVSVNPDTTKAVVLAGGRGTRLAPYTSILPKPLMPIGNKAILEIVVSQLGAHGFTDIAFSVGYLSHLIRAVFDHRADKGVDVRYVHEEVPLGTAGPLRLVDGLDETFMVMNGDVLTTLDYRDLVRYHCEMGNTLTIATRRRTVRIDYGVLHVAQGEWGARVQAFEEKPEIESTVSMGVYVFDPSALDYIPDNQYFDLPDIVQALLVAGQPVGAYLYDGLWFDIGRQDDYEEAVRAWGADESESVERTAALTGPGVDAGAGQTRIRPVSSTVR
jgi:NDP-sugar pyrophosphorylase family protein